MLSMILIIKSFQTYEISISYFLRIEIQGNVTPWGRRGEAM